MDLSRVHPGRGSDVRARLVVAAWLLGLGGVTGVALAGKVADQAAAQYTAAAVTEPPRPNVTGAPSLVPQEPVVMPGPQVVLGPIDRSTLGDDGLLGGLVFGTARVH